MAQTSKEVVQSTTDFAIGAFVWNDVHVVEIMEKLRLRDFRGRIIVGGPQVSYVSDNRFLEAQYPDADIFVRGYAEDVMVSLMSSSEVEKQLPKGVYCRGTATAECDKAEVNFESLPSPFLSGLIAPQRFIRWETQRGCPFRCSFCQHRQPEKSQLKSRRFARSRVDQEIEWICDHPVIADIAVVDPTFNTGLDHVHTINMLTDGGYRGEISLQCRAELVKDEFLRAIKRLHLQARPVLEFGLQTIHEQEQQYIDRPTNLQKIECNLRKCLDSGIPIEVSLIFGLPGQTLESFQQSVRFCQDLGVPTIRAFPLMLLRGTKLFDRKHELGLVESCDPADPSIDRVQEGIPHVVSSKTFSRRDWEHMAAIAADLEND